MRHVLEDFSFSTYLELEQENIPSIPSLDTLGKFKIKNWHRTQENDLLKQNRFSSSLLSVQRQRRENYQRIFYASCFSTFLSKVFLSRRSRDKRRNLHSIFLFVRYCDVWKIFPRSENENTLELRLIKFLLGASDLQTPIYVEELLSARPGKDLSFARSAHFQLTMFQSS